MKKFRIVLLILVVILIGSIVMTGCTSFKINKERQANEVLATVSLDYDGTYGKQTLSLNVTRNELLSYVNYLINLYTNYNMTYDVKELVENGLDGLINQKYMTLEGMVYLLSIDSRKDAMYLNTDEYKAVYGNTITPEGVLTLAERYSSIATTNETFVKSIEDYVTSYVDEQREIVLSNAKEKLTAYYNDGYTVKDTVICKANDDDTFSDGLYKESFIYVKPSDSNNEEAVAETDYKQIYLKIVLKKDGVNDEIVYYPVATSAVKTAEKSTADMTAAELKAFRESEEYKSNYITVKTVSVTYDEPIKPASEEEETTYKTHTATADFTLVTPRAAYSEPTEEDTRSDAVIANEGDVKFRYTVLSATDEAQKAIIDDGQIFKSTLDNYASDAEKDAYRQFREEKAGMLIGFDAADTSDAYKGLGYYYKSSFESAILSAVQHELGKTALADTPVTDASIEIEYKNLIAKQKEEYDVLTPIEQVKKFATTIGTDLSTCYYVPVDALTTCTYEKDGATLKYAEKSGENITINMFYIAHILFKWTTELKTAMESAIEDYSDEQVKEIKKIFIEELYTNKTNVDYETNGVDEEKGDLASVFETAEADGTIKEELVTAIIAQLNIDLADVEKDPLETFQKYMSLYNDDGGTMSSKLGYFVSVGDIENNYENQDYPNMAKELYADLVALGNPNGARQISEYAFTTYGLHIEYISFAPFYNIILTAENGLGIDFELNLDGDTFKDTIKTKLEETKTSNAYNEWTSKFDTEEIKANHAEKNEKKLKKMIKDLGLD